MAVNPKRKDPGSTRPVYLPKVPAKELREVAKGSEAPGGAGVYVYRDAGLAQSEIEELAQRLGRPKGLDVTAVGEVVVALAGRPHSEVREAVATAGNRLAWARINDPETQEYKVLPRRGEVDEEEALLRARPFPEYKGNRGPSASATALYDASEVQAAMRELLAADGDAIYVVATARELACWDESAKKWAPQTVVAGNPILVSAGGAGNVAESAEEVGRALG